MAWNLYENDKFLEPLCFSNGKTQQDVVEEVLKSIEKGNKIIFIHGQCGTGKSAIALNLAKELGKTSIVVPGKNLQNQYKRDYEGNKYLKKENGEKLKISVITGRRNHKCKFLEDNQNAIPMIKKEINSKLHDIFAGKREEVDELISDDISANNSQIPCKIEIREKNWQKIKKYIQQNKKVNLKNFSTIKDVKRMSVAPVCPYWSPVVPEKYEIKSFGKTKQRTYKGLDNVNFIQYKRKPGCAFYEQFDSYFDSDVIVFNSLKYKLETALLRKPRTEIEVIDECDEFLDSFSNERIINIERLQNSLIQAISSEKEDDEKINEALELINHFKKDPRINNLIEKKEIVSLKATGIYDLLKVFIKEHWLNTIDDESYLFDVLETAKMFWEFLDESYVTINKHEKGLFVHIVTTNLAKKLKQLVEKNKVLIMMSGTIHSEEVLKTIFGLEKFDNIDAETKSQGVIKIQKTGLEMDCKYSNFSNGNYNRKEYLKAFEKCIEKAKKPVLVHVHAYMDLPSSVEIYEYDLKNMVPREEVREMQFEDNEGKLVKEFKEGKRDILFSTRDSRGVDFPGEECNSIIFTKYPNPNVQNAFWKILAKTKPQHYWRFYKDKAKREFLQKIYRGLRFKNDHINLLSPDIRVLEMAEREFG